LCVVEISFFDGNRLILFHFHTSLIKNLWLKVQKGCKTGIIFGSVQNQLITDETTPSPNFFRKKYLNYFRIKSDDN